MSRAKPITYSICLFLLLILVCGLAFPISVNAQDEEEEEMGELEASSKFPVLSSEGTASLTFEIEVLYKGGEEKRQFDLSADVPEGFTYSFEAQLGGGQDIQAIVLDPNRGYPETIKLTVRSIRLLLEPGEFPVSVTISSEDLSETLDLKAVITGIFDLELDTPTGRMNAEGTAGKESTFVVVVQNTGSVELQNVELVNFAGDRPDDWTVTFDPEKIDTIPFNEQQEVTVTVTTPKKTISGDYLITIEAETDDAQSEIEIRMTVVSPNTWLWVGVAIIVVVIIGLAVMFLRFGRR